MELRAYEIKINKGNKEMTWIRISTDIQTATRSAEIAIENEFYGKAKIAEIKETDMPN